MPEPVFVRAGETNVFVRELDRPYPLIVKGEGVWLEDAGGTRYLDAVSGGAMVTSLGHGPNDAIAAAAEQAGEISFIYNQQFTSPAQEALAEELTARAPAGFGRVHFVTGGAEANETALRLVRAYHVERGEPDAHAHRLARPGLPRADDGDARPHRPRRPAPAVRRPDRPAAAHPALDLALRPVRRGRARRARPGRSRRRARAPSPRSSPSRSAPPRSPATRRPTRSGAGSTSGAPSTAS